MGGLPELLTLSLWYSDYLEKIICSNFHHAVFPSLHPILGPVYHWLQTAHHLISILSFNLVHLIYWEIWKISVSTSYSTPPACYHNNHVLLVLDDVISNQGNQDVGSHGNQANSNQGKQDGSTTYYRKSSKSEEIIHDLSRRPRPKAEGKVF